MLANIMLLYANVFTFYQQQLAIIVIPLPKDLIQYIRTVFFWIKRLDVIHGNYSFKAVHILYICIHIATLPIDIYDITVSMMTYGAYVIPQTYFSWWCVCVCVCESEWVSEWERDRQREREREREREKFKSFIQHITISPAHYPQIPGDCKNSFGTMPPCQNWPLATAAMSHCTFQLNTTH